MKENNGPAPKIPDSKSTSSMIGAGEDRNSLKINVKTIIKKMNSYRIS